MLPGWIMQEVLHCGETLVLVQAKTLGYRTAVRVNEVKPSGLVCFLSQYSGFPHDVFYCAPAGDKLWFLLQEGGQCSNVVHVFDIVNLSWRRQKMDLTRPDFPTSFVMNEVLLNLF